MSPWARIDDQSNSNAKLLALSDGAYRMYSCGLVYCQANLTDGFIPDHAIEVFGVRAKNKKSLADELCQSLVPGKGPLWHVVAGGYEVHDFLEWNDSREEVLLARQEALDRKERWKASRNAGRKEFGTPNGTRSGMRSARAEERVQNGRSTSTTTSDPDRERPDQQSQDQKPRAVARRTHAELLPISDVRSHLIAAAHGVLDLDPDTTEGELTAELKQVAARLRASDYTTGDITKLIDAVRGERAKRHA